RDEVTFIPQREGNYKIIIYDSKNEVLCEKDFNVISKSDEQKLKRLEVSTKEKETIKETQKEQNMTLIEDKTTQNKSDMLEQDFLKEKLKLKIKDKKGEFAKILLYLEKENKTKNLTGEIQKGERKFNKIVLNINNSDIKKIELENAILDENSTVNIEEFSLKDKKIIKEKFATKTLLINYKKTKFTKIKITSESKGTEIWICKDWNFENNTCNQELEKIIETRYNTTYELDLKIEEIEEEKNIVIIETITILNPITYLRDNEIWTVEFNTTGTADLIISSNNSNWTEINLDLNETTDEMKFLDLKCGNNSLKQQIKIIDIDGNIKELSEIRENESFKIQKFLIEDYSCEETSYFSNLMLKAGYAILKFEFGEQTAYAIDPLVNVSTSNITSLHISVLEEDKFVLVFCDDTNDRIVFRVYDTNGSLVLGDVVVDSSLAVSACDYTSVSVSALNSSHFVVGWIDSGSSYASFQVFDVFGNAFSSRVDVDTTAGTSRSVSVSAFNDTHFVFGWYDQVSRYASFRTFTSSGSAVSGVVNVDTTAGTCNAVSVSAFNSSHFVFGYYDQASSDVTFRTYTSSGSAVSAVVDADTNAGASSFSVSVSAVNSSHFVIGWYDQASGYTSFRLYNVAGTLVGVQVNPDTAVGTTASGVMIDVSAINTTSFVFSWFDNTADIGTFYSTYSTFGVTTPTAIANNISVINNSLKYHTVGGYQAATQIGFCEGNKFVIAFTNTSGLYWKTYYTNGTEWDGICPDKTPPNVTLIYPNNNTILEQRSVDFNFTVYDKKTPIIPNCSLWANISGTFQEIITIYNISINTITNITLNDLEDKNFIWNVKCYDSSNNFAFAPNNYTLIINYNPPNITNPSINTTIINQSEFVRFNTTITDNYGISYAYITIRYPNSTYKNFSLSKNNDEYYLNFNDTIQLGIYNITFIWANDTLGKSNYQNLNLYFEVTPSPPAEFDLISPKNRTESKDLTPTLSWQQTIESNFANYTILISKNPNFTSIDYEYHTFNITNTSYKVDYALDANAVYYWKVIAYDIFGNYRESTNYFVYITDTIAPNIQLINPENNTVMSQFEIVFSYIPQDTNTIDTCALYSNISGSFSKIVENNTIIKDFENNLTTTINNEGIFVWNVWCNDSAGNSKFGLQNYTLKIDFSPPKINLISPQNNHFENETNIITFIANATDTYSNISYCKLIVNDEVKSEKYNIINDMPFNFTIFLTNGNYTWRVNCTDYFGFENSSTTYNLTVMVIDSQPPFLTIIHPENNSYLSNETVYFNYTPQDSTGIENCSLIINNSIIQTDYEVENFIENYFVTTLEEGFYVWKIGCYDNSSEYNYGESTEYTLIVDLTNPQIILISPENNSYSKSNTNFTYMPIDSNLNTCILFGNFSGIWKEESINYNPTTDQTNLFLKTLEDGIFVWNVWCNDSSGRNSFAEQNLTLKVDSKAPQHYNNLTYPESPTTYDINKEYSFIINWTDNFKIKEVIIEHNFTGTMLNITLINITNEEEANNTIQYNYSIQNLNSATYYYRWYATDFNNNTNTTPIYEYIIEKANSKTELYLNGIKNNLTIDEDNYVNISAQLIKPQTGTIKIYVNNSLIHTGDSPTSINYLFEDPGIYNVTAVFEGNNNYINSYDTLFVNVNDITPPEINLTYPSPNALIGFATINFNFIVYDKSMISNCSLIINDTINQTSYNITTEQIQTFTQTFEEGNYTWQVECYDIFGNYNISEKRNFTYIKSDKIIGYAQTSKPQYQKGEPAVLIANTTDIFGSPLITNITKAEVIFGNTTIDWWNNSWKYRKQIFINNPYNKTLYKTIDLNVSGISSYINNCEELRIVVNEGFNHTQIPTQIISNYSKEWCLIRFNANITRKLGVQDNYWLYYGNPNATSTGQTISLAGLKVQRNWYYMTTTSALVNIEPLSTENSFVMLTVNIASGVPSRSQITSRIYSSNQLLFERYAAVTAANISWQIVESSEIKVQKGTASFATAQLNTTINLDNEVNLNESFIIVMGRANSGTTGNNNQGFFRAMFLNSTTIYIERATSGSAAMVEWQVIQWSNAKVQSGNFSFSSLDYNVSVSPINTSRAFLIFGSAISGVTTIDGNFIGGNITDSTTLRFYKETTTGTAFISWFLVEMPEEFKVQKNSSAITADTNIIISPVITTKAFHVQSWSATTATTTYTQGFMRFELQNSTNLWEDVITGTNTKRIVSFIIEEQILNVSLGTQQEFKTNSSGETNSYGIFSFDWSTKNQSLGTYSLVFIAEKENFTTTRAANTFEIIPDTTKPTVTLLLPENNYTTGVGYINFSYIPFDYNLANCTLYIGNDYVFNPNITDYNPINNQTNYFNNIYFRVGIYYWNVKCEDTEGNFGFAIENYTLNISGPDLVISEERIWFNQTTTIEGYNITVFANITNLGLSDATDPFIVQFYYGDPAFGGTQLGNNITVQNLSRNNFVILNTSFVVKPGINNVFVILDPNDLINESDETNNKANNSIIIPIYQYYYGNVSVEILLGDYLNRTLLKVESIETNYGNIIISDVDSSFSFNDLIPLTRNINNQRTNNDFTDLDIVFNTTNTPDSIKNTWGLGTDDPIATATFNISGRIIENVPIINSTNNSNFITGILWDSADDLSNNYQFDYNDKEDIVFVTKINPKKQGKYGIYDYEIRIPSLLKNYKPGTSLVNFYIEII
ncbi:MAG: hypothetical protein QXU20_03755, partial [Candidatus Woesearchaeota archaeon]